MALSNIFREPRREITESVVGLAIFGGAVWADYAFAGWLQEYAGHRLYSDGTIAGDYIPWPLGMVVGFVVGATALLTVVVTHALGDGICNALQNSGIHLRPRNRPQQR